MKITEPGIYEMSAEDYHQDCCAEPSLSRGIAHLLTTRSPRHAHYSHPRLSGNSDVIPTRAMDDGSIVHSLMLGKGSDIVVLNAVYGPKHERAGEFVIDYATKAAQEERDAIRCAGKVPALVHQMERLKVCASAALDQLRTHPDGEGFFAPGRAEAVVVWEEDGLWFRCMVDRLPDDPTLPPYDVKATKMAAAPSSWERRLQNVYAFQDAFYRRGIARVRGIRPPAMKFPVIELDAPHCLSVMSVAPSLEVVAEMEVERAITIWRHCMRTDTWPGYPPFTAYVEAPNWMLNRAEEQALRDEFAEENAA